MKPFISRFIAMLLLALPGIAAAYGFLLMKDSIFDLIASLGDDSSSAGFGWLHFMLGLLLFALGVGFIGGWVFFRDRKRNYVAPRFKAKKRRTSRPPQS